MFSASPCRKREKAIQNGEALPQHEVSAPSSACQGAFKHPMQVGFRRNAPFPQIPYHGNAYRKEDIAPCRQAISFKRSSFPRLLTARLHTSFKFSSGYDIYSSNDAEQVIENNRKAQTHCLKRTQERTDPVKQFALAA